ncbi:MAG: MATE family efflux transporter [Bacteroidetes bacterium]|nr:MAG: MATE family efflux transporter [Bacteroidota bacterium]
MLTELKRTLPLAYPLILSNLTQMAFGLIDTAMVGAVNHYQLAAAGLVVNAIAIPQVVGMGLGMGMAPLVAMAQGQNKPQQSANLLYNGFWLSVVAGAVLALVLWQCRGLMTLLGQDVVVGKLAVSYFGIMGLSLFPMMIFLSLKQFADGLQHTKIGMVISIVALAVNALLCWMLIFGNWGAPRLELEGAGWATLITRVLQAVAMAAIIWKHQLFAPVRACRRVAWHFSRQTQRQLLQMGIPSSLQYAMEAGAFSVSGIIIGWLGATTQAAHQIALNCASFTFMAAVGLSLAGSIRVSHAFGQQNLNLVRRIGSSTLWAGLGYGLVCAVGFVLLRHQLPLLFTTSPEVATMAAGLMLFAALFQMSDASQAIGVGLLRGVKDVKRPTLYVALAYWVVGIPVGYALAFKLQWGAAGIWMGLVAGLTMSSLLLNHRFFRITK